MRNLLFFLVFTASAAYAEVTLSIPDPYDPLRRLPLDSSGTIECMQSKLDGIPAADCAKAKKFYSEQFSEKDLRFTKMADSIRPNPKYLVAAFLTPDGVKCPKNLAGEKKEICAIGKQLYKKMEKEEKQVLLKELDQTISPLTVVPLDGDFNCSWGKLSAKQYKNCQEQNAKLKTMLFEQRLEHNKKAIMLIELIQQLQRMARRGRCG